MLGQREMGIAVKIPLPFPDFRAHSEAIWNREVEQITQVLTKLCMSLTSPLSISF